MLQAIGNGVVDEGAIAIVAVNDAVEVAVVVVVVVENPFKLPYTAASLVLPKLGHHPDLKKLDYSGHLETLHISKLCPALPAPTSTCISLLAPRVVYSCCPSRE